MMNTKIVSILCLAIGLVAGYALRSLFTGSPLPASVVDKQIAAARQEQQLSKQYEERIERMAARHAETNEKLTATKAELAKAKALHAIQTSTARRLTRQPNATVDTAMGNCDSMATATLHLIATGETKDSLYEQTITLMEQDAAIKDSVIGFQNERVGELQQSLADAMEGNQQLADANNALLRQIKRHT